MLNTNTFEKLEEYGENTICYTLDGKDCLSKNTSLAITKANELVELDGGRELLRTNSKSFPNSLKLHGEELDFDIVYATPDTKKIAEKAVEKYRATLVMIY